MLISSADLNNCNRKGSNTRRQILTARIGCFIGKGANIAVELRTGIRTDDTVNETLNACEETGSALLDCHFDDEAGG